MNVGKRKTQTQRNSQINERKESLEGGESSANRALALQADGPEFGSLATRWMLDGCGDLPRIPVLRRKKQAIP